jgi:hypothetical protein
MNALSKIWVYSEPPVFRGTLRGRRGVVLYQKLRIRKGWIPNCLILLDQVPVDSIKTVGVVDGIYRSNDIIADEKA